MAEPEVAPEKFVCPIELKPMTEWVKVPDTGNCRPCTLAPVVQWYWSELKEKGRDDIATRLEQKVEGMDDENAEQMTQVCEELDAIKAEVDEPLRQRLLEFDCEVQSLDLDEISRVAAENVLPPGSPAS